MTRLYQVTLTGVMSKPRRAVVAPSGMSSGPSALPASGGPSTPGRALGDATSVDDLVNRVGIGRDIGPLDIRCSYCRAQPYQRCRDRVTGVERDGFHGSREHTPVLDRWRAWHGDRNASRLVPPL